MGRSRSAQRTVSKHLGQYFKGTKKRKIKYPNGECPSYPLRRNKNFKENSNEYED